MSSSGLTKDILVKARIISPISVCKEDCLTWTDSAQGYSFCLSKMLIQKEHSLLQVSLKLNLEGTESFYYAVVALINVPLQTLQFKL